MTSTTGIQGCRATVARQVRDSLTVLSGITGPKDARIELGLSLARMGEELGNVHPNGHGGKPFHRSAVGHWEQGDYPMTPETQAAYLTLIERLVSQKSGGRLTIKVRFGRTWRITPLMVCECGVLFKFRNVTDKHCPKCRR